MAVNRQVRVTARNYHRQLQQLTDGQVLELTKAWVEAWDALKPLYVAAVNDLMMQAEDGYVKPTTVIRHRGLQDALNQTRDTLNALGANVADTISADVDEAVAAGAEAEVAMIEAQLPPGTANLVTNFAASNPAALAAIVERTTQQIVSTTQPLPADVEQIMRQELMRGIAVGDSPRNAAAKMVRRAEQRFNGGLNRATTIARTEMLDAGRTAAQAADEDNADIVDSWQWEASLDHLTCPACLSMHGTRHPVEVFGPKGHPNCRCTRLPVTKPWSELGFNIDEAPDTTIDSREWFDNLEPDVQLEIMGRERLDLLQSGAVSWSDLGRLQPNTGWRDSYQATPVKVLRLIAQ